MPLLQDELLYSYLLRLSVANGMDDIRRFADSHLFSSRYANKGKKYVDVSYDIRDDLYRFATSLTGEAHMQVLPFYVQTSLFGGIAPLMLRHNASRYVGLLSKYHNHSRILSHAELMIQSLQFCPQCRDDDLHTHGQFYYRRAHQMPGVTVCHKHGCALHRYVGERGQEMAAALPAEVLPVPRYGQRYAVFVKAFLDAGLRCDRMDIADAVQHRVHELGDRHAFDGWDAGYRELAEKTPAEMLHYMRQKDMVHMPSLLTLLLYLFGTVEQLKTYLPHPTSMQDAFDGAIEHRFEAISVWREDLSELRCRECGTYFLTTPSRILSGWGCPVCDGKLGEQVLFRRLFDKASGGEYELLSAFDGMGNAIRVRHLPCGREYDVSAKDFVECGVKCSCKYALQENAVRQTMQRLGFELRTFRSTTQPMTLYHPACGGTFEARYHMFLKTPHCRVCDKRKADITKPHAVFLQNVRDLVGDEYTVLEPYVSTKTPLAIRHNVCHTTQTYAPKHFLDGQRCKVCQRRISDTEFARIVSEVSYGRYTCTERMPPNKVVIRDAETDMDKTMTAQRVMQELFRPTPSPILPLARKNTDVALPRNQKDIIMEQLNIHFRAGDVIDTRTLRIDGLMRSSVTNGMGELAAEGRLMRVGAGRYVLPTEKPAAA